jgi:hypothetical protein
MPAARKPIRDMFARLRKPKPAQPQPLPPDRVGSQPSQPRPAPPPLKGARVRGQLPTRQKTRSYLVRQFAPESNEHVEKIDEAPVDALHVVSSDAPKLEAKRKAAESKARGDLEAAKARGAELEIQLAGAVERAVDASSKLLSDPEAEIAARIASAAEAEADKARIQRELAQAKAEQERFAAAVELHSRPSTSRITFMFRLRAGELSDDARLEGAMLVPGEGAPIPLVFEGGNAGRSVTMSAAVPLNTTVYVALHLVGLAGVAVEVLLLGGGTIMSVHA